MRDTGFVASADMMPLLAALAGARLLTAVARA